MVGRAGCDWGAEWVQALGDGMFPLGSHLAMIDLPAEGGPLGVGKRPHSRPQSREEPAVTLGDGASFLCWAHGLPERGVPEVTQRGLPAWGRGGRACPSPRLSQEPVATLLSGGNILRPPVQLQVSGKEGLGEEPPGAPANVGRKFSWVSWNLPSPPLTSSLPKCPCSSCQAFSPSLRGTRLRVSRAHFSSSTPPTDSSIFTLGHHVPPPGPRGILGWPPAQRWVPGLWVTGVCFGLERWVFTELPRRLHQPLQMTFQELNYDISVLAEFRNRQFDYICWKSLPQLASFS